MASSLQVRREKHAVSQTKHTFWTCMLRPDFQQLMSTTSIGPLPHCRDCLARLDRVGQSTDALALIRNTSICFGFVGK